MFAFAGGFGAPAAAAAPAFGSAWPPAAAAAAAVPQVTEKVPIDPLDRALYALDRACGVGPPLEVPELARQLKPGVQESAERPLTKMRELLKPYRKTEYTQLDRLNSYEFRVRALPTRARRVHSSPSRCTCTDSSRSTPLTRRRSSSSSATANRAPLTRAS